MSFRANAEEDAAPACAAILHHLLRERDLVRRDVLLADFANKIARVPPELAALWRDLALRSVLPNHPRDVPMNVSEGAGLVQRAPKKVDVAIITVTPLERRAAITAFDVDENDFEEHNGRRYYPLSLPSQRSRTDLNAVLTSVNWPLNPRATKGVMEVQQHFDAAIYILLGIAAGRRDRVSQGDIVIPDQVMYYEAGRKTADDFQPRGQWDKPIEEVKNKLSYHDHETTDYFDRLRRGVAEMASRDRPQDIPENFRPNVIKDNAVLASGEKLIQDGLLQKLFETQHEGTVAGDQEAFGFALGLEGQRWAIFRGISDYGEKDKPKDWQYVAVYAAGLLLRDFLEREFTLRHDDTF